MGATVVKDLHELEVDGSLSLASTAEAFVAAAVVVVDYYVIAALHVNTGPLIRE